MQTANIHGVASYLTGLQDLLGRIPETSVAHMLTALTAAYLRGRRLYFAGNGGSAATASHFVCDLTKSTQHAGAPCFRAFALNDNVPLITAWSNDSAYDNVFAAQLAGLVEPGDVVVLISGSGKSPNILRAATTAREHGAVTIGMTGFDGGALQHLVDVCVVVPSTSMEHIEDAHLALEHAICREMASMVRTMEHRSHEGEPVAVHTPAPNPAAAWAR